MHYAQKAHLEKNNFEILETLLSLLSGHISKEHILCFNGNLKEIFFFQNVQKK